MKQSLLPKSWITDALENSDSDSDFADDSEAQKQKKILYWTRVKSLDQMKNQRLMIYDSVPDLDFDKNLKKIRKEMSREPGSIIFDPAVYKKLETFLTMEANKLPKEELERYARIASDLRARFTRKADELLR